MPSATRNVDAATFVVETFDRPDTGPRTQRYVGERRPARGPEDVVLWTVERVDDGLHTPEVTVRGNGSGGLASLSEPSAIRGLAQVLLAQTPHLEMDRHGYTPRAAAMRDLDVVTGAWEADSSVLSAGLVAGYLGLQQRLAAMARDMLAALDGDDVLGELWDLDPAESPTREADLADRLGVAEADLRGQLALWAAMESHAP